MEVRLYFFQLTPPTPLGGQQHLEKIRSLEKSAHPWCRDYEQHRKRKAPVLPQGLKREVSSSLYSKSHKHMRNKYPSQEPEILPGSSNQGQTRRSNPPLQQSSRKTRMEADRTGETRRSTHGGHSAVEGRPALSRRKPTVRPCPYYLRIRRFKEPEGLPEEQRSTGIDSLPQNSLRRRSLSVEALDGDPADRST
ncbi:uncharacterized protein TNCV_3250001 [Trichonephila clavipes]|nr:uncharacterized protein TNCV_3250001 [Trichonephila clavipes]